MSTATRWRWTGSIRAAFTLGPAAARYTPRLTMVTTGWRSHATCRPCCLWRCKHCHDSSRVADAAEDAGARERRGPVGACGAGDPELHPGRVGGALPNAVRHHARPADAQT